MSGSFRQGRGVEKESGLVNRRLDAAFDDSLGDGEAGEACDVVDVQLLHQMLTMLLNRFDADAELGGNLLVGLALRDQLKQFRFTRG